MKRLNRQSAGKPGGSIISPLNTRIVRFQESFVGDGIETQFQLTSAIEVATLVNGTWNPLQILNTITSDVTNVNGTKTYDSLLPFVRNLIVVNSITTGGLVTLSDPPRSGVTVIIYYRYELAQTDRLDGYNPVDIMTSIESDVSGVNTGDDRQALVNNRKTAPQAIGTLSGETDNIITFPVPNPSPTAPTVMNFDGTILSVLQRHPSKFSELQTLFVFSNSGNSSVNITVNLRVSIDGGVTFPLIVNTETFSMLPKSGATPSTIFAAINEWVSPMPSTVPVFLKVQAFASLAGVVNVEPGSVFVLKGVYK